MGIDVEVAKLREGGSQLIILTEHAKILCGHYSLQLANLGAHNREHRPMLPNPLIAAKRYPPFIAPVEPPRDRLSSGASVCPPYCNCSRWVLADFVAKLAL